MPRTDTSARSEFAIPNGGSIKFLLPPGSSPEVTITLFAGSKQATGLHWHETHTEILRVTQGAACVEIDGVVRVITERDAAVAIKRACDISSGGSGEDDRPLDVIREELEQDLVIIESTDRPC